MKCLILNNNTIRDLSRPYTWGKFTALEIIEIEEQGLILDQCIYCGHAITQPGFCSKYCYGKYLAGCQK